jgi:hypothetical protein
VQIVIRDVEKAHSLSRGLASASPPGP